MHSIMEFQNFLIYLDEKSAWSKRASERERAEYVFCCE